MIQEGFEPDVFWTLLLNGRETWASGTEWYHCRPPRFLRCSCSEGYFSVEEVLHHQTYDLKSDTCVILDPGAPKCCYVWMGQDASDVVIKLTRKSVEVWLDNLADGRKMTSSMPVNGVDSSFKTRALPRLPRKEGHVVWIRQGFEDMEFKAFFYGWDDEDRDPRSIYLEKSVLNDVAIEEGVSLGDQDVRDENALAQ